MKYAIGKSGVARMYMETRDSDDVFPQCKTGESFWEVDDIPGINVVPSLRGGRDARLRESDWTQLPDSPLTDAEREAWAVYRQALRDMPSSQSDDAEPTWPEKPTTTGDSNA